MMMWCDLMGVLLLRLGTEHMPQMHRSHVVMSITVLCNESPDVEDTTGVR